jgi:hypothetical protein
MDEPACGCRRLGPLGYTAWQSYARARVAAGQRQKWCRVCKLWRWPDELGLRAEALDRPEGD